MTAPAQLFVFPHNWESTVVRKLSWKTDIIMLRDGSEQRRRLRKNPKESLTYSITMTDAEESAQLARLLWATKDLRIAFPRWEDAMQLAFPLIAGDTTVLLDAPIGPRKFLVDAILYHESIGVERLVIDTLGVDQLNLLTPVVNDWPDGVAVVPVITGYVEPQVSGSDSGQLQETFGLTIDVEEDIAGITSGGDSVPMVPATINAYLHGAGAEGIIAFGDTQGIVVEVLDAAGSLIPDADVTIDPAPGPSFIDVYKTGAPNIWNVRNLRADTSLGTTPQTVSMVISSGAISVVFNVQVE